MKKFITMILVVAMVFSLGTITFATDFSDVSTEHNNYEAIEVLETIEIVKGNGAGAYGPSDILTRAQLCTMLTRAIYGDEIYHSDSNIFADVEIDHWAYDFINTAYINNLMIGYGNDMFGPEDELSYTQTARTILNALGYGELEWPTGVDKVALKLGLYENMSITNFEAGCTRAHAAQMIYNAFDLNTVDSNSNFLNDVLGFTVTTKTIDGHVYLAYENTTTKEVFVTDIRESTEKTIYPIGIHSYRLTNSYRGEIYKFDWDKVSVYVNETQVKSAYWFTNAKTATGIFDENGNLISIHIVNKGYSWTPYCDETPEMMVPLYIILKDKDYNERTSTITYYAENNTYKISNKYVCGFVNHANLRYVSIGDEVYDLGFEHGVEKGAYLVIFYDVNDEISDWKLIENPFQYNLKTFKYHAWDCQYYGDHHWDNDNWANNIEEVKTHFQNSRFAGWFVKFEACEKCSADEIIWVKIPASEVEEAPETPEESPIYVEHPNWEYVHDNTCKAVTSKPNDLAEATIVTDLTGKKLHDCIGQ